MMDEEDRKAIERDIKDIDTAMEALRQVRDRGGIAVSDWAHDAYNVGERIRRRLQITLEKAEGK